MRDKFVPELGASRKLATFRVFCEDGEARSEK